MQKVLRKRILRDLKKNIFRYFALGIMIVLGMYMVVSLAAAGETVMQGVKRQAIENKVEDGEFSVFIPLKSEDRKKIEDVAYIEEMFYRDYKRKDGSILRSFINREKMNRISLSKGRLAKAENELVLEKQYASQNNISLNDKVTIGNRTYQVVGVGTVPDYDAPKKEFSTASIDSKQFGLAFFSKEGYRTLAKEVNSEGSEVYQYAYRLKKGKKDKNVKSILQDIPLNTDEVDDRYFKEYWERTAGKRDELEDGIEKLHEASMKIADGSRKLTQSNDILKKGSKQIFDANLKQVQEGLQPYGLSGELTRENYSEQIGRLVKKTDSSIMKMKLKSIIEDLDSMKAYDSGITNYTGGVSELKKGASKLEKGAAKLQDSITELLDKNFKINQPNLTMFVKQSENSRILASVEDQKISLYTSLFAGVIVMILFTYVISVFVIHGIEQESSIIGALYALGMQKRELIVHYLMLPVVVTALGGIAGTLAGFSSFGVSVQMQTATGYFSMPELETVYPVYLIIYGVLMPPVIAVIVNYLVIRKKLNQTALSLIKNENKQGHIRKVSLGNISFIRKFQIRQTLREMRTGFTVLFGMFISLLVLMLGVESGVFCSDFNTKVKEETKYEHMYVYKYPEEHPPKDGEKCFSKSLSKEVLGYKFEINVMGISSENPYFRVKPKKGEENIVISSAMAEKYCLKVGDVVVLRDDEEEKNYAFNVKGIKKYNGGYFAFMDIKSMRKLFGEADDYYNVLMSDHKLSIDKNLLYSDTTRKDVVKSSEVFSENMLPMVTMLIVLASIIFAIVMYLMQKVMIDRSGMGISLVKMFGYNKKEVKRLYLQSNFYLVAVGALILIPLAKKVMDAAFPFLISNAATGVNVTFGLQLYAIIYVGTMGIYLIINQLLVSHLNKMSPTEILKNRE